MRRRLASGRYWSTMEWKITRTAPGWGVRTIPSTHAPASAASMVTGVDAAIDSAVCRRAKRST